MKCFPPIMDKNTEILFLGSFPGPESLKQNQYYAHPQNQFWKLVGSLISEDLHSMPYRDKIKILKQHKIGLWDVINKCEREGSSDTNIKNKKINDFERISKLPNLKLICFNGKTSGKFINDLNVKNKIILPSSSPANTAKYGIKLREWKKAFAIGKI